MTKETKTPMTLNSLSSVGTSKTEKELVEGLVLELVKLLEGDIKDKNQDQVETLEGVLRVDKCHFK